MNALLCKPYGTTDADICDALNVQEDFVTRPMQAVQPECIATDEEALHLSFEEAISDRIVTLNMNRYAARSALASTGPLRDTTVRRALSALATENAEFSKARRALRIGWQRVITYVCIALMLMLIGFDLMGLLILRLH
jgi:membrane-bound ClpP family serine protease